MKTWFGSGKATRKRSALKTSTCIWTDRSSSRWRTLTTGWWTSRAEVDQPRTLLYTLIELPIVFKGFCIQMNFVLAWALRELGYDLYFVSIFVYSKIFEVNRKPCYLNNWYINLFDFRYMSMCRFTVPWWSIWTANNITWTEVPLDLYQNQWR